MTARLKADGFNPGTGTGCAAGSLRAAGNVVPVSASSATGDTTTSYVVGGIVTAKARRVVVAFADGICRCVLAVYESVMSCR